MLMLSTVRGSRRPVCTIWKIPCLLFTEENYNEVITSNGFEDLDKEEIIKIIRLGNETKKRKRKP